MQFDEEEQNILTALENDTLVLRKPDEAELALLKTAAISTFNSTGG